MIPDPHLGGAAGGGASASLTGVLVLRGGCGRLPCILGDMAGGGGEPALLGQFGTPGSSLSHPEGGAHVH